MEQKKYICEFNDGEYIATFKTLEEAKKFQTIFTGRFINRYVRIREVPIYEYYLPI